MLNGRLFVKIPHSRSHRPTPRVGISAPVLSDSCSLHVSQYLDAYSAAINSLVLIKEKSWTRGHARKLRNHSSHRKDLKIRNVV